MRRTMGSLTRLALLTAVSGCARVAEPGAQYPDPTEVWLKGSPVEQVEAPTLIGNNAVADAWVAPPPDPFGVYLGHGRSWRGR